MNFYWDSLFDKLNKSSEDLKSHVNGGTIADEPGDSASWLHWVNCVDESVHDSADCRCAEDVDGKGGFRRCKNIEECNGDEWQNVLQVVSVSSANSFNV